MLAALVERRDRLVSKNELLEVVWPHLVVEENNLQVQISALRKLLGPDVIATIPGRGYKFTAVLESDEQPRRRRRPRAPPHQRRWQRARPPTCRPSWRRCMAARPTCKRCSGCCRRIAW